MKNRISLYQSILEKREKISLVGLGYVGMPLAVAFSSKVDVIGFDISDKKIQVYKRGIDPTKEVGDEVIRKSNVYFTSDENRLREAKFQPVLRKI